MNTICSASKNHHRLHTNAYGPEAAGHGPEKGPLMARRKGPVHAGRHILQASRHHRGYMFSLYTLRALTVYVLQIRDPKYIRTGAILYTAADTYILDVPSLLTDGGQVQGF